jgi:succinate-semialdehyde dehydrogenase/glutarate-semialdehyde dehydrogenase
LFLDAGAPKGTYTNVYISNQQAAMIVADPRIKGVALTGSERPGSAVAAEAVKKNTMELGGSDAFIVLDDADMDKAIEWAVWGRMNNAGQCCVGAKRFILQEKIADEFLSRFKSDLAKFVPAILRIPRRHLLPCAPMGPSSLLRGRSTPLSRAGQLSCSAASGSLGQATCSIRRF